MSNNERSTRSGKTYSPYVRVTVHPNFSALECLHERLREKEENGCEEEEEVENLLQALFTPLEGEC